MKTTLALVLAATVLISGAAATFMSTAATAGGPLPTTYCGQNFCPPQQGKAGPLGTYRGR